MLYEMAEGGVEKVSAIWRGLPEVMEANGAG